MANSKKSPSIKRNRNNVAGQVVFIKSSELTEKRVQSKYKFWQLWLSKLFSITPEDKYQYCFRIKYYGNVNLKTNDIVMNSQKVIFLVIMETNRLAMIVTKDAYIEKPKVYGSLTIVDRLKPKGIE